MLHSTAFLKTAFCLVLLLGLNANGTFLRAAVQPNSLFTDGMVLQRDTPVPIWGTAANGEKITVKFAGQSVDTTAQDGKWLVKLQPLNTSAQPSTLTISGENTVTINNVLVGDVWVCSGQSNMERQLGPRPPQPLIDNWEQEAASADFPNIREFFVPEKGLPAPIDDLNGKWVVCTPQTAPTFSAISFFFARALYQKINVPIGLLFSAVGGTPVEAWTSKEALESKPEGKEVYAAYDKALQDYPAKLADFQQHQAELMQKYNDALAKAQAANQPPPPKPGPPHDPAQHDLPNRHYNAMIAPIIPYAIRGAIWYQGEANSGHGKAYQTLFPLMISDWRQRWGEGDFPFLFVQLAPYRGNSPDVREAQLLTAQTVAKTAVIVTTDLGDPTNVHPPHKAPVGERLALAARAVAYGEKIEYSGPLFDKAETAGSQITIHFTHVGSGLLAKDGALKGFEIAGADKKFSPADAVIKDDTVVVSSATVPTPVYVRYGWNSVPEVNLYNKEELPASPFRTDTD